MDRHPNSTQLGTCSTFSYGRMNSRTPRTCSFREADPAPWGAGDERLCPGMFHSLLVIVTDPGVRRADPVAMALRVDQLVVVQHHVHVRKDHKAECHISAEIVRNLLRVAKIRQSGERGPMGGQPMHPTVGVALTGGGHRAALFHVRSAALSDRHGQGPLPTAITSVSGGSFTNGFIGQTTDFAVDIAIRITFSGTVVRVLYHRARRGVYSTTCPLAVLHVAGHSRRRPTATARKWGEQGSENASSGSAVSTADLEAATGG